MVSGDLWPSFARRDSRGGCPHVIHLRSTFSGQECPLYTSYSACFDMFSNTPMHAKVTNKEEPP